MKFHKRHPVWTYFVLTFVISWGGILIVVGPGKIPGAREQFERLPVAILALLAGPSVTGLLPTWSLVLAAVLWVAVAAVAGEN